MAKKSLCSESQYFQIVSKVKGGDEGYERA